MKTITIQNHTFHIKVQETCIHVAMDEGPWHVEDFDHHCAAKAVVGQVSQFLVQVFAPSFLKEPEIRIYKLELIHSV